MEGYIDALCTEIRERGASLCEYSVDTLYFGGGTPSLLTIAQLSRVFEALRESFSIEEGAEITLECNPMTHTEDGYRYFSELRSLGVNRLSVGVQSACDAELKLIGRRHTFAEAKKTFFDAREAGFSNISLDLMLALPSQTAESLERSISELVSLSPEHISIYSLQLEEGTPLATMRDRYAIPSDDEAADMYELTISMMRRAGYEHYEISNFAKEGKRSRHNQKYWRLDEYLGVGLAAHSDILGARVQNTCDMQRYLSGNFTESSQAISERERMNEYVMLGLRTSDGISCSEFADIFGEELENFLGGREESFYRMGLLLREGDHLYLSERGAEVSNAILSELLNFED